jgi:phosphatidylinositol alpha-1,6-mannosyltransferase
MDDAGRGSRILALVSDAHGGFGGISQYNRDALEAMAAMSGVRRIEVMPRIASESLGMLPDKVHYDLTGLGGRARFVRSALWRAVRGGPIDLVYCAHINLLPVASIIHAMHRVPVVLAIYGIDAWQNVGNSTRRRIETSVAAVVSISELTSERFLSWCPLPPERMHIVPNGIKLDAFGQRPRNAGLLEKFGLNGKKVVMTLGRMASKERMKGFDELIELMPRLSAMFPNVVYLAVGDGSDRSRLELKAERLGMRDRVVFTGRVDDETKLDLYRCADVYAMPSCGEGFGFVVIEAMACGTPVVASSRDGTREAVRHGELGVLVDPMSQDSIFEGIVAALRQPRGIPDGLSYFSQERFAERLHGALASARPALRR